MPSPSDTTSPGTSAMMFRATRPTWRGRGEEEEEKEGGKKNRGVIRNIKQSSRSDHEAVS